MIGEISLIKIEKKVMPAVCIDKTGKSLLYLQLAPANEEDEFNSLDFKDRMKKIRANLKIDRRRLYILQKLKDII